MGSTGRRQRNPVQRAGRRLLSYVELPPEPSPRERAEAEGRLEIGVGTYGGFELIEYDHDAAVRIGAWCSIGDGVRFMPGGNHVLDRVTTYPLRVKLGLPSPDDPWTKGDIVVGNDVWIGRESVVLSGVTIGDGAVVAGFSVVTSDVEPYEMVGGHPARPIGRRLTADQAERMARISWWDWDPDVVRARVDELSSPDIEGFLDRYDPDVR